MKRYFIEEAKCDITAGGMACGPMFGNVVASVKFREGDETQWLNMIEVAGTLEVALTEKDIFDDLVKEDFENEEFYEYLDEHCIGDLNGIVFGEGYRDIFESIEDDPQNPAVPLIKYIITLVRCDMEDTEGLLAMAKGKYADELDIPMSDVEEEYLEENE